MLEKKQQESRIGHVLPYVAAEPLSEALPQMGALRRNAKVAVAALSGAACLVDVAGFSALARHLVQSDAASAAEQLCAVLNEYIGALVARLHARGAEVLLFAGDAVLAFIAARPNGGVRAAAEEALAAALELRGMAFAREGYTLTCHTGIAAGSLDVHVARAEGRLQALYGGELVAQAAAAQRASARDDIVLSGEAAALLQIRGEELPAPPRRPPLVRLPGSYRPPSALGRTPDHGGWCACGAPASGAREAAAAALEGYADEVLALAPTTLPAAGAHGAAFWVDELRNIFCVFASFPELDSGAAADAERFGAVARAVVRVADEFGGALNKLFVDDKGCSALIGFGIAGHAHEDDAERAVRSALALRKWFEEGGAPFACGVASGRTFSGTLGAPCRREHALIGDCIIIAARLMTAARGTIAAAGGRAQLVLCERSVAEAAAALPGCGLGFEETTPVKAKGLPSLLAAFLPRIRAEIAGVPAVGEASDLWKASEASEAGLARSWKCVGREAELAAVAEAVEAAACGRGTTVVVEAEAGHGKTRLLEEAERLCAERGATILRCAARRLEDATPLFALRGALASLADCSAPEAMRAGLAHAAGLGESDADALWDALFAEPERDDGRGAWGDDASQAKDRWKTYRAVRGAVRVRKGQEGFHMVGIRVAAALAKLVEALERGGRAAGAAPRRAVALFLEDAHWADSSSFFVLRCLRAACPRLLLLITSRPMEEPPRDYLLLSGRTADQAAAMRAEAEPGAVPAVRGLDDGGGGGSGGDGDSVPEETLGSENRPSVGLRNASVTLLRLGPLGEGQARGLLEGLLATAGLELPPATADLILRKAAGVPLYLVELCRQLHQARDASAGGGPAAALAVPDSVQQLILSRADRLSAGAQAALKLCAIAAAGFTQEAVTAVDPTGMGPEAMRAAFGELTRAGLVAPEPDGRPAAAARRYSFVHALMRDAVYSAVPEAQRREAHGRLARFLEGRPDVEAAVLAAHWRDAGEVERALPYLERAAQQAAAQNALPESRALFSELCLAIDDLGLAGPAVPPLRPFLQNFVPQAAARRARRASTAGPPAPAEQERWRARLGCALRSWAQAEYYIGRLEPAADVAALCIETLLGWRIPYESPAALVTARLLWTVLRLARHPKRPPAEGRGWLHQPAQREARVALLECGVVLGMALTKGAARMRGSKASFMLAAYAAVRAVEVSAQSPAGVLSIADVRIRGMWISFLDHMGLQKYAHSNAPFFEDTAHALGHSYALLWIHNHRGQWAGRAGRIREATREMRLSVEANSASPFATDARLFECIGLALLGSFAEAAAAVDEAVDFFQRFGLDESAASLVGSVGAWTDLLTGRDARAARILHRARALLAQSRGSLWFVEIVRVLGAVLDWRRGDLPAAIEAMEATFAFWRAQARATIWISLRTPLVRLACVPLTPRSRHRRRCGLCAVAAGPRPRPPRRRTAAPQRAALRPTAVAGAGRAGSRGRGAAGGSGGGGGAGGGVRARRAAAAGVLPPAQAARPRALRRPRPLPRAEPRPGPPPPPPARGLRRLRAERAAAVGGPRVPAARPRRARPRRRRRRRRRRRARVRGDGTAAEPLRRGRRVSLHVGVMTIARTTGPFQLSR